MRWNNYQVLSNFIFNLAKIIRSMYLDNEESIESSSSFIFMPDELPGLCAVESLIESSEAWSVQAAMEVSTQFDSKRVSLIFEIEEAQLSIEKLDMEISDIDSILQSTTKLREQRQYMKTRAECNRKRIALCNTLKDLELKLEEYPISKLIIYLFYQILELSYFYFINRFTLGATDFKRMCILFKYYWICISK